MPVGSTRGVFHDRVGSHWNGSIPTAHAARSTRISISLRDRLIAAEAVFVALVAAVGGGEVFLDVPGVNPAALALARDHGLAPVFETARMYTGPIRPQRLERVFGVCTFELG